MSAAVLALPTSLFVSEYVRPYSDRRATCDVECLCTVVVWALSRLLAVLTAVPDRHSVRQHASECYPAIYSISQPRFSHESFQPNFYVRICFPCVLRIPNRHNNQFTAVSVEGLLRLSNLSSRYRDIVLPRKRNAGFTFVRPVEVAFECVQRRC